MIGIALFFGRRSGTAPYLLDCLRQVLGLTARWGRHVHEADARRVAKLRDCVARASTGELHRVTSDSSNFETFISEVREHASGHLAPLIQSLVVGWDAPILSDGLVLVDLPGVGVANDQYASVTSKWVRKARSIVLVVDKSGVTEASASLLRTTGFLNRLLYDSHDSETEPVTLAVVVVKVDESANAAWRDDRALHPGAARKWGEHFENACADAVELIKNQLQQELAKLVDDGPEQTRAERQRAISGVLRTLQVHPVSAPQYRSFHAGDEEDPPRIKTAAESRVPRLANSLGELAKAHRARAMERDKRAVDEFSKRISALLDLTRATWEQDTRAEEAEQLRADLEAFLAPRQQELERRRGAFRDFLRESIPWQIDARVAESALIAGDDIGKFLRRMEAVHWSTLKATVQKGGEHVTAKGKRIDLPNELALRFEEPVAIVWSRNILPELRRRTEQLGKDYVDLVGEVVDWARKQSARVQPRVVEALHQNLLAQTADLASVGNDAIDELKKQVGTQLHAKLLETVTLECATFVEQKKNEGPGVKNAVLAFFHGDLTKSVVQTAGPVAKDVLLAQYNEVQLEIATRFKAYKNPLEGARDAIVRSHEDGVQRSDAHRRRRVLEQIDHILETMPRGAS